MTLKVLITGGRRVSLDLGWVGPSLVLGHARTKCVLEMQPLRTADKGCDGFSARTAA